MKETGMFKILKKKESRKNGYRIQSTSKKHKIK